jgi:hypothetical protein
MREPLRGAGPVVLVPALTPVVLLPFVAAPVGAEAVAVEDAGAAADNEVVGNRLAVGADVVVAGIEAEAEEFEAVAPNREGAALLVVVAVEVAGCAGAEEPILPKRLPADGAVVAAGAWLLPNKPPAGAEVTGGMEGFNAPNRELPEPAVAPGVVDVACAEDEAGVPAVAPNSPPPSPVAGAAPSLGACASPVAGFAENTLEPNVLPKVGAAAPGAALFWPCAGAAGGWNMLLGAALF